jgi:predicted NAD/FAD-dependent oxidoreductase
MNVVVIGAGLSGLMAAQSLQAQGHKVLVVDKGRSVGGRLATRRIGTATLDHGAQFFTVRSDEFAKHVDAWLQQGVVREWCKGFATADGHSRFVGVGGMNAIAKHLATSLEVRCNTLAFAIERGATTAWRLKIDDGSFIDADSLIVTCPIPQAYALLVTANVQPPDELLATEYHRTLGLLATLDAPPNVASPGGIQDPDDTFSFVADNQAKGLSETPAITLNANNAFSLQYWDYPPDEIHTMLIERAKPWLGRANIVESQVKRWRFATPATIWPDRCWHTERLVLAGDAFGGPKVEGAALSGLAAAKVLSE